MSEAPLETAQATPPQPSVGTTLQIALPQRLEGQFLYAESIIALPAGANTVEIVFVRNEVLINSQSVIVEQVSPTVQMRPTGTYSVAMTQVDLCHIRMPADSILSAAANLLKALRAADVAVDTIMTKMNETGVLDPNVNHAIGLPTNGG